MVKFNVGNALKRLGIVSLAMSLSVTSVGITSLAAYSEDDNMLIVDELNNQALFEDESFIIDIDSEVFEEAFEDTKTATASNPIMLLPIVESVVTVTDFDELSTAIAQANAGIVEIIEVANDIYLEATIAMNASIIFRASAEQESVSLYSLSGARHFQIQGSEVELITENVVLDGQNSGGGILNFANHLILNAVIRDSNNNEGGAIWSQGDLTITSGELSGNTAVYGGAIYSTESANIVILDGNIFENNAEMGAAIFGNANWITINGGEIYKNNASTSGGAITASYSNMVFINDGAIYENSASEGGAIYGGYNTNVLINSGEIYKNNARSGGAVYSASNSKTVVNGGEIYDNAAEVGGAVYGNSAAILIIDGGHIQNNHAEYGGGVAAIQNRLYIYDGMICDNVASQLGGGIYGNQLELFITGGTICHNVAELYGGGIYNSSADRSESSYLSGVWMYQNSATAGGAIFTNHLELLEITNATIKDNHAALAYELIDEDDIALHYRQIASNVQWTDGFDYIYNNLDVGYTDGTPIDIYMIAVTEYFEDSGETKQSRYNRMEMKSFHYDFAVLEGYTTMIESNAVLEIDIEAGTIDIDMITGDIEILITYKPVEETHTVIITTHYLDGIQADQSTSYQVKAGDSFEQTYDTLEGYELAGFAIYSFYPWVDGDTQTVYIERVEEDFEIVINLNRKTQKISITTQYLDGILPDETKSYDILYGEAFAEGYEALEGYQLAGFYVRSYVWVDGENQVVYINEVKDNYHIVLQLERAEHTVTITVTYPEGTIEDQVFTYPVLYGESFLEQFEVVDGYRVAGGQGEKGVIVNFLNKTVSIDAVTKDISVTIICR